MTKSLILITVDCLRNDHLNLYGYDRNVAPNIEKIAKESLIFENAIANGSYSAASFYSMFTSTIPTSEGAYSPIPERKKKLAEIIQKNKFLTCGILSNPQLTSFCNYHLGFDTYIDIAQDERSSPKKKLINKIYSLLEFFGVNNKISKIKQKFVRSHRLDNTFFSFNQSKENSAYASAKNIISEAIKWLKINYKSNFFLWIHLMDVHRPYYPPSEYIEKVSNRKISESYRLYLNNLDIYFKNPDLFFKTITKDYIAATKDLYDAELCYADHHLGILFQYLKKLGIYNSSNIIITADHGQSLFDHNCIGHRAELYDELLRIPFIVKLTDSIKKQHRFNDQIELRDLAPTILEILDIPKEEAFHGTSLYPLIMQNKNYHHPEYVISAIYHYKNSIFHASNMFDFKFSIKISCRNTNWKLIYDDENKKTEFFNLKKDPNELNDLNNDTQEEIKYVKNKMYKLIKPYIKNYDIEQGKIDASIKQDISKFI